VRRYFGQLENAMEQLHVNDFGTAREIYACRFYVRAAIMPTYLLDVKLLEEHRSVHRTLPEIDEKYENQIQQMNVTEHSLTLTVRNI
jgi:hypothetical protein